MPTKAKTEANKKFLVTLPRAVMAKVDALALKENRNRGQQLKVLLERALKA